MSYHGIRAVSLPLDAVPLDVAPPDAMAPDVVPLDVASLVHDLHDTQPARYRRGMPAQDSASGGRMHADEIDLPVALVARLVAEQFPGWAGLAVRRVPSAGTVNAMFRLGEELAVRLPRVPWGVDDVVAERRWVPVLAPYLPVPVPVPVAQGRAAPDYPWSWSVLPWLPGANPTPGALAAPEALARDLAAFVDAFRRIDIEPAPQAYRGGPLGALDTPTRAAIEALRGVIDTEAAVHVWDAAVRVAPPAGAGVWVHADLMPGNLLTVDGRLSAVIDFATAGVGDPACDLIVAWNLLPAGARSTFRAALGVDDACWERGRARALSMALIALPYYAETNPTMAAVARHTIREVLADPR